MEIVMNMQTCQYYMYSCEFLTRYFVIPINILAPATQRYNHFLGILLVNFCHGLLHVSRVWIGPCGCLYLECELIFMVSLLVIRSCTQSRLTKGSAICPMMTRSSVRRRTISRSQSALDSVLGQLNQDSSVTLRRVPLFQSMDSIFTFTASR